MSKTWLSILTALLLINLSVGMLLVRRSVLGVDIDGPRGLSAWKVTVTVVGAAQKKEMPRSLTFSLPPDFRRQHIIEERQKVGSIRKDARNKKGHSRELHWQAGPGGASAFRLVSTFRAIVGMRQTTGSMRQATKSLDKAPAPGEHLQATSQIQSEEKDILQQAKKLTSETDPPIQQVRALFDDVSSLELFPSLEEQTALDCFRDQAGDSLGKSRLLVALCRARGIPARLVTGLLLTGDRALRPHHQVEAWAQQQWLPMCPTYHRFGQTEAHKNFLVLHFGDSSWIRGENARFVFSFQSEALDKNLSDPSEPPSKIKSTFQRLSLHSLAPQEQSLVKFLLLLPPAALIVCIFRIVIGLPTFGTYGPALLGLSFLDWTTLPWGIAAFVIIVMVGWVLRRALNHYRLLMVPRTSALLTLIVIFLVGMTVLTSQFGIPLTNYLALFPLVILTHMVERFWTVEAEDGTVNSFKGLFGTLIVTVTVSLAMAPKIVTTIMFRYPELLGVVLAVTLLLGRYSGYRLSELRRFQDLTREPGVEGTP